MAVKGAGLDGTFGLQGLTVILALVAVWLGTRRPGILKDFPSSTGGAYVMTGLLLFVALWFGARNPSIFGSLPVIGKAAG